MRGRRSLKSGARLAFGSDFPVESPNPFPGLAAAISRQDMNGQPPGGWLPEERVSFEQALSRLHARRGLCRLRRARSSARSSPANGPTSSSSTATRRTVDPQALARTQVLETWVAGKKVWERASAAAPSAGDKHRRRQDLRQLLGLARPARTTGKAARRPRPRLSRKRVISGSPLVQSPTSTLTPAALNAPAHLVAVDRGGLIGLAGQAPVGGEIDEHRLALLRRRTRPRSRSTPPRQRRRETAAGRVWACRPTRRPATMSADAGDERPAVAAPALAICRS